MKFAIIGAGYIASIHARAVHNCGAQVVAVVEKYSDKSAAFARQFEVSRQYSTVDELLKDGGADAMVVGTPNFLHAKQTLAALKAGIPVL
ncbi:MAG: Gfo/Idh/MocA family oxidoreductase, partial [Anaerolineales bacterium]|nr:Gfo/Idh/MocA family oxidoreductase [Anaerolineales bacterium]